MIYIYTLSHPITNEVRYVGKTINVKRRFKQHLYDKRHSHKASWVKSLKSEGLKPIMTIVETCTDNWQEREIYWINQYDNLTNLKQGGGVDYERTTSEETKEKIRQANLGKTLSEETKEKIGSSVSKKLSGKTKTIEHKKNLSKNTKSKRQIIIDDVKYDSVMEASKILSINRATIQTRLKSKNMVNYQYV